MLAPVSDPGNIQFIYAMQLESLPRRSIVQTIERLSGRFLRAHALHRDLHLMQPRMTRTTSNDNGEISDEITC